MPEPPEPSIYQLRAVLLGISPIIWRRLLVRGDSTIADLHVTLQTAFGCSDNHLHRFLIQFMANNMALFSIRDSTRSPGTKREPHSSTAFLGFPLKSIIRDRAMRRRFLSWPSTHGTRDADRSWHCSDLRTPSSCGSSYGAVALLLAIA